MARILKQEGYEKKIINGKKYCRGDNIVRLPDGRLLHKGKVI